METDEWLALLVVALWSTVPHIFTWFEMIILYPVVDKTIFLRNKFRHGGETRATRRANEGATYERLARDDPEVMERFADTASELELVTGKQTWTKLRLMDSLIVGREWYSLISYVTGWLFPLWIWPSVWTMLLICRTISGFYVFYDRDRFPETFFGFMVVQVLAAPIFDMLWFPMLFKLRLTSVTAYLTWAYSIFFTAIYITRATYHAKVGFGFATFELVYCLYLSWLVLIIMKNGRSMNINNKDVSDIYKHAPVTVVHEDAISASVLDSTKEMARIENALNRHGKQGYHVHPGSSVASASLLYYHGMFPPVPVKTARSGGWYLESKRSS